MRSVEFRFEKAFNRQPISSLIAYAEAVTNKYFSVQTLHREFSRLVNRDDYQRSDRQAILTGLEKLNDPLRTTKIQGKLPQLQAITAQVEETIAQQIMMV